MASFPIFSDHGIAFGPRCRPASADPDGGGSGGQLYEAACRVREALRGRAALLVVDRTDIVDAAEADGVLLSPKGAAAPSFSTRLCGGIAHLMADVDTCPPSMYAQWRTVHPSRSSCRSASGPSCLRKGVHVLLHTTAA